MTQAKGIFVSPSQFVQFADSRDALSAQIATRARSAAYQSFGMTLPNPDPVLKALGKDIEVYRELRADAHVGGCIRRRKAAVRAMEWSIDRDQEQDAVADEIEAIFNDLPLDRIIGEMLDATLYGYQPMEVLWGTVGGRIVPLDVIGKPPNWFLFDPENRLRFRSREAGAEGELVQPKKILLPRQDPTYDNPYGVPDLAMVYWPTIFKRGGIKFWVYFTEKYGSPWLIGKHPRSASTQETDQLLDTLEQMVQDACAVIPDDASVEIHEAAGKTASADVFERLLTFCRSEVSIALLGQNQTTEANANRASATAGLEVARDIRDGDCRLVEAAMNRLIEWICDFNFSGRPPKFRLWEPETVDQQLATRDELLTRAGARLTAAYFQRAYELEPGDLDTSPPPATAGTGFGGGFNGGTGLFAEGETAAPDQEALDAALESLSPADLEDDIRTLLAPVFSEIEQGATPETLLQLLADVYPQLDRDALQERLTRAIFVAQLWGRVNG